jgi:hypothetical protein
MTLAIKGVKSVSDLETLVGRDISHLIVDNNRPSLRYYKGDDYYRKRAYCVRGNFSNGGQWYAGVMIYKGKLLGIQYPNPVQWQKEWNE